VRLGRKVYSYDGKMDGRKKINYKKKDKKCLL